jgi:hypothetical protein
MKTRITYRKLKSSAAVICLLCALSVSANTARIFVLSADDWARPRSGTVIAEFDALRAAVSYWDKVDNGLILVRYPGEDSGEFWAAELRDWLISLGVPSDHIRLVAGTQAADEIRLLVGDRNELEQ